MLAKIGAFTCALKWRYWSSSVKASAKIMSAPAAIYACARSIPASKPSTATASVRAMITKLGSVRASTAALMRSTISSILTTALLGLWPQRFCDTWSSMCTAATPTFSNSLMVRAMLNAPPQPVSISTNKGTCVAEVMRPASISTSFIEVMPKSGKP